MPGLKSKLLRKSKVLWLYLLSCLCQRPFNTGAIFLTRGCDRSCPYCYTAPTVKKELELPEIKAIIDKFKELGIWYLALYGGEPTLRADLADIISYARRQGMFVILHTNGSFKNVSVSEVVAAGIDVVDIAIDSIAKPNLKNYEMVKQTIKELMGYGVRVKLNFCIIKENIGEVTAIIELVKHLRVPISIHLGEQAILATDIPYDANICFGQNDVKKVEETSKLLAEQARKNILMMHLPEYFENWLKYMRGEKLEWKCKAESSLCVDSDGTILLCQSATFPLKVGDEVLYYNNINKNNIALIKQEMRRLVQQCNPRCLSCANMLQYYLEKTPWRFLRIVLSF